MPPESEFEEVDANNPIVEAKALWNNVWAYCADCGEQGDVSLPCKTCNKDTRQNQVDKSEVEESQELGGSIRVCDYVRIAYSVM